MSQQKVLPKQKSIKLMDDFVKIIENKLKDYPETECKNAPSNESFSDESSDIVLVKNTPEKKEKHFSERQKLKNMLVQFK